MQYSKRTSDCIEWIRDFFKSAGKKTAVVGISGGKDSAVCANLCVEALGQVNVIGVLMPNSVQKDIKDSYSVISQIGIRPLEINIGDSYDSIINQLPKFYIEPSQQTKINLAPRLRMATLYAVAQSLEDALVCNCTNKCESIVGYGTIYGDISGDFAPLADMMVSEVIETGLELGLSKSIMKKAPSDGLSGKTDEENLGFTYFDLEGYLIGWPFQSKELNDKIQNAIDRSKFKRTLINIPHFVQTC